MKLKDIISKFVFVFFLLVLISDFYYKYYTLDSKGGLRLTLYVKIAIGVTFFIFIARNKFYKKINAILFFGLLAISLLSFLQLCHNNTILIVESYGRYYFGIIVLFFFINEKVSIDQVFFKRFLSCIIIINFIFIIFGYLNNLQIFRTYYGSRFGFNGIFKSTSVASYFYIFSICYYTLKKKSTFDIFVLVLTVVSAIFVGSKSIYGFIIYALVVKVLLLVYKKQSFISGKTFFIGSSILIISSILLFLKQIMNLHSTLREVMENDGVLSAVFSYRDVHFRNTLIDVNNNFELGNFIYGGLSCVRRYTEISIVDLFITFGLVGLIIYILLLYLNIPKIKDRYTIFLLLGILGIIFLRGNFFYFPSVIFMSILIFANILNVKKHE